MNSAQLLENLESAKLRLGLAERKRPADHAGAPANNDAQVERLRQRVAQAERLYAAALKTEEEQS